MMWVRNSQSTFLSMLHLCMLFICFFFFKQKTAYEMRISDWSSDVCSSDLVDRPVQPRGLYPGHPAQQRLFRRASGGGSSGRRRLPRRHGAAATRFTSGERTGVGEGTRVSVRVVLGVLRILKQKNKYIYNKDYNSRRYIIIIINKIRE